MRALMPMLAIKVVPPKSTKMERTPSLMRRKAYSRKDSAPPITHNFCESSNRVRITCTGTLHTCLGHEDASDLRKPLRTSADNDLLSAAIDRAIGLHHRPQFIARLQRGFIRPTNELAPASICPFSN
jgi:molybdenum cofactor biosynthesis enzyme MoaA